MKSTFLANMAIRDGMDPAIFPDADALIAALRANNFVPTTYSLTMQQNEKVVPTSSGDLFVTVPTSTSAVVTFYCYRTQPQKQEPVLAKAEPYYKQRGRLRRWGWGVAYLSIGRQERAMEHDEVFPENEYGDEYPGFNLPGWDDGDPGDESGH